MQNNKIIIINGTSSAGKTSLATSIQNMADDCYYYLQMDRFHSMLPKKYRNYDNVPLTETVKKGFYFDENKYFRLGEYARNVNNDIFHVLKTLAERKRNVLVDIVMFELEDQKQISTLLKDYDCYIIRIFCEVNELNRREQARGDRFLGHAEKQIPIIDTEYNDLVLNSTNTSPDKLAEELLDFVKNNKPIMLNKLNDSLIIR